jgi:hypothetical protein
MLPPRICNRNKIERLVIASGVFLMVPRVIDQREGNVCKYSLVGRIGAEVVKR